MPVYALWSAPRARSTAFFRSMLERGDMVVVHEPFSDLAGLGETDVDGRPFDAPLALLAWLRDETGDRTVFLKDTPTRRLREVFADRRFLADARHAFLIRRPEEIAASSYAVEPNGMELDSIGVTAREAAPVVRQLVVAASPELSSDRSAFDLGQHVALKIERHHLPGVAVRQPDGLVRRHE